MIKLEGNVLYIDDKESFNMLKEYLSNNKQLLTQYIGKYALIVQSDLTMISDDGDKLINFALKKFTNKSKAVILLDESLEAILVMK